MCYKISLFKNQLIKPEFWGEFLKVAWEYSRENGINFYFNPYCCEMEFCDEDHQEKLNLIIEQYFH